MAFSLTQPSTPAAAEKEESPRPSRALRARPQQKNNRVGAPQRNRVLSTKYTDQETGLVMYPARPYSPSLGRWLSRDPLAESGAALLRNPALFGNSSAGSSLGIDLKAVVRSATEAAARQGEHQLYQFNMNDGVNFVDPLGLMRYSELEAKIAARKKERDGLMCCTCPVPDVFPGRIWGDSLGATVAGYYNPPFRSEFMSSPCIIQPEIYWYDCYSASEEAGWWNPNWIEYGWSGPGSFLYIKRAQPSPSLRDPYNIVMMSIYVWDECHNGRVVTSVGVANVLNWVWDKKANQWFGPAAPSH